MSVLSQNGHSQPVLPRLCIIMAGCFLHATVIACSVYVWQDGFINTPNRRRLMTSERRVESVKGSVKRSKQEAIADTSPRRARPRLHNRVQTVMVHVSRYSFQGRARLAADAGVSRSTISRMINGQTSPSHALVQAVTEALAVHLKKPLVPRDLFSPDGCYSERSGCRLSGCTGCLPEAAFDLHGRRRVEWLNAHPGDWSLSPDLGKESNAKGGNLSGQT